MKVYVLESGWCVCCENCTTLHGIFTTEEKATLAARAFDFCTRLTPIELDEMEVHTSNEPLGIHHVDVVKF